jgi:hypothetical protein
MALHNKFRFRQEVINEDLEVIAIGWLIADTTGSFVIEFADKATKEYGKSDYYFQTAAKR